MNPDETTPPPASPVVSPAVAANQKTQELPQPTHSVGAKTEKVVTTEAESKRVPKKTAAKKASSTKKSVSKDSSSRKAPAKKGSATAKKTAAKKASARSSEQLDETQIAQRIVDGSRKWNTGRDRDEIVKGLGLDPAKVRSEVSRIRGENIKAESNS